MQSSRVAGALVVLGFASMALAANRAQSAEDSGQHLPASVVTLAQAKTVALAGNPSLQALEERVAAATAVLGQARADLYPQVSTRTDVGRVLEASPAGGNAADVTTFRTQITAQWLLFDGFSRGHRIRAAEHGRAAARQSWEDARRLLLQGVAGAFLNTLLAEEIGRVAERDAAFNRELRLEAEHRFTAGAGARVDILNFSVREREALNRLSGAERDTRAARTILATLLGLPGGVLPDGVTLDAASTAAPAGVPEIDDALRAAMERRPDLLGLERLRAQAEAAEAAARSSALPAVGLVGEYSLARLDNPRFSHDHDADAFVGIAFGWDLFDGYRRRHAAAEAAAQRRAVDRQLQQQRLDIAAEVRRAVDAVRTAAGQLENQREITAMSREIRAIARQEYSAGLVSLTRLNEVQTDLVRAEGALVIARIRLEQTFEDLAAVCADARPNTDGSP